MRNQRVVELAVGLFMLIGFLALLFLALQVSGLADLGNNDHYKIDARFTNIGDLKTRAAVTIAGVKVGYVQQVKLDPRSFMANVTLAINKRVNDLPVDTSASILTEGLLGSNYISLTPGFDVKRLQNGDKIMTTHSAFILENLIGQLMYKVGDSK